MPLNELNWIPLTHLHIHTQTNWYNCKQFFANLVCNLSFRAHFNANLNLNFCYRKVNKTKLRELKKTGLREGVAGVGNAEWEARNQVNRAKEKKLAIPLNLSGAWAKPVYDTKCHKGHEKVGRTHKRNTPPAPDFPTPLGDGHANVKRNGGEHKMKAKKVGKGRLKTCGQQIKCIRNWKSQYTSGQRSWQWRIVQSNALTPLLTSVQGPADPLSHLPSPSYLPCTSSASVLRPGTAWDPSCIVLQIDFVARLQDRPRRRLAKRGQQFAKQHCAYTTTTKLFGIFSSCVASDLLAWPGLGWQQCGSNSTVFLLGRRNINCIPQCIMYN